MPTVIDKYKPINTQPATRSAPWRVILTAWIAVTALSLYNADHLHAWVEHEDDLRGRELLLPITGATQSVAVGVGALGARQAVERLVDAMGSDARLFEKQYAPLPEPTPEPTPPPEAPKVRNPFAQAAYKPRRVLLIGASSVQYYLGAELERRFETYEGVEVLRYGKLSTGLARPDVFDWHDKLDALKKKFQPDLSIAQFGGNDCQPMQVPGKGPQAFANEIWSADYGKRVERMVGQMREKKGHGVMVGMPIMRSKRFSRRISKTNALLEEHAAASGGLFLSTWDLAGLPDRKGRIRYRKSLMVEGKSELMRLSDGIHFSRPGGQFVADRLLQRLERHFTFVPEDQSQAVLLRHEIDSKARGRKVPLLVYVPQDAPIEGLPLLVLLHGATGSFEDWPEHAHRELQRLAGRLKMVIAVPDGDPQGWYVGDIETHLMQEVLPHLQTNFPINAKRGIAGLSMGGHGALTLSIKHPGAFQSASSMSGVLDLTRLHKRKAVKKLLGPLAKNRETWEGNSAIHLALAHPDRAKALALRVTCGRKDKWFDVNERFHKVLTEQGVDHVWEPGDGGHDWPYWTGQLTPHLEWHATQLHGALPEAPAPAPSQTPTPAAQDAAKKAPDAGAGGDAGTLDSPQGDQ